MTDGRQHSHFVGDDCAGGHREDAASVIAKGMSERDLSQHVVNLARMLGWKVARWPTWRATGTDPGVPDLLLARGGIVLLVELKSASGRLSEAQESWLEASGGQVLVYRPQDWLSGEIERLLRHGNIHAHCADEYHRCGDGGGPGEAARYRA